MQECLLMSKKDGHAFLKLNYPVGYRVGLDTTLVNLATKYSSWSVDCDRVISSKGENISGVLIFSPEQQTKKNTTARLWL